MTMFFELNTGAKDPVVGLGTWQADARGIRGLVIAVVKFHIMTLYISIRKLPPSSIHKLLPDSIKSFSVSSNGHFTVNLQSPCYIHFNYLVHYADTITGVIKYGSTDELKGIKAEEEFELVAGHRFADEGRGGIHAVLPFDMGFCLFSFLRNGGLGFGWQWASSALKLGFC
ncbi:uncharacterized protein LOC109836933 isoform X3 [Asparagus officinalis]|nr:uncharacterized protein LOC109836933 isoform X3 [Asparagus officinalis]